MESYAFVTLMIVLAIWFTQSSIQKRVDLNYKLLSSFLRPKYKEILSDQVAILIKNGDDIKAIKQIRDEIGLNLKDAKELMRELRKEMNSHELKEIEKVKKTKES